MVSIQLTRAATAALRRGHPWVYREAILRTHKRLPVTGETVELLGDDRSFLGRGLYEEGSPIAVRLFDVDRGSALTAAPLAERIVRAIARRDGRYGDDTTAYRLCNGEGDRCPGMVLDRYAHVVVLRLDTSAWKPHLSGVVSALAGPLAERGVRSVGLRVTGEATKLEGLHGTAPPERVTVREHGMVMEVDLAHGQKTGAFLDQRDNRARVRALARGRVLNLFSYTGGFSLAAALGGAAHVTSVDVATAAHATAQRSFRENRLDPGTHAFVSADVFTFLEQARARGERFEVVISDPPSFAPSERALPRALTAYRRLHAAAAAVLAEGGVLCAASCSSHVTAEDFVATLDDAVLGRADLGLAGLFGQPDDHPTLPAWPEGRYLKFAVLR